MGIVIYLKVGQRRGEGASAVINLDYASNPGNGLQDHDLADLYRTQ